MIVGRPARLGTLLAVFLGGCVTAPAPVDDREIDTRVRQPAQQDSAGVQVFPLENPAVTELMADASTAEQNGQLEQASMYLERALRIPRTPSTVSTADRNFSGSIAR